jgi:hypothetical protein
MIHEMKDYSFVGNDIVPTINDGDIFIMCNLTQETLGKIFEGVKDLKFISCNCQNVIPDPTWEDDEENPSNWSECDFTEEWEEVVNEG